MVTVWCSYVTDELGCSASFNRAKHKATFYSGETDIVDQIANANLKDKSGPHEGIVISGGDYQGWQRFVAF